MLEVSGQQLGPKMWNFRLWLERCEAVGWIWSLACFMQPISREVWLPNFPAEHPGHEQALPGCAMPECPAGLAGRVRCACLWWAASVSLLFLHSQLQAADRRVAALWFCFIGFGFISFFGFSVRERLGFPKRLLTHPGTRHVGLAGQNRRTRAGLTPSWHLWPCCRTGLSAAGGQRGSRTPGSLLCPGRSPCKGRACRHEW